VAQPPCILMQVCQESRYEIHKLFTIIYVHRPILDVKLGLSPLYDTLYIRGGSRADFEDPRWIDLMNHMSVQGAKLRALAIDFHMLDLFNENPWGALLTLEELLVVVSRARGRTGETCLEYGKKPKLGGCQWGGGNASQKAMRIEKLESLMDGLVIYEREGGVKKLPVEKVMVLNRKELVSRQRGKCM
jgi:hypothetical protein